jgi:hypothetical protein
VAWDLSCSQSRVGQLKSWLAKASRCSRRRDVGYVSAAPTAGDLFGHENYLGSDMSLGPCLFFCSVCDKMNNNNNAIGDCQPVDVEKAERPVSGADAG